MYQKKNSHALIIYCQSSATIIVCASVYKTGEIECWSNCSVFHMFEQRANQIDMTAQSELMASFEENL